MMYHDVYYRGYFITSFWGTFDLSDLDVLVALGIDLSLYDFNDFKIISGCFKS